MSVTDKVEQVLREHHGHTKTPNQAEPPKGIFANVKVKKYDEDGVLQETRSVHNIVTSEGAQYVRSQTGDAADQSALRWTAIGNSATNFGSGSTQLQNEQARSKNQFNAVTGTAGQFSNVTTFTDVAASIRESGIFNDDRTNSGTMFAAQSFGVISLTTDDKLEVIWKVYYSEV